MVGSLYVCWAKVSWKWSGEIVIGLAIRIWRPRGKGLSVFDCVVICPCLCSVGDRFCRWEWNWASYFDTFIRAVLLTTVNFRTERNPLLFFYCLAIFKLFFSFSALFFFCIFLWNVSKFPAIMGIGNESTNTPDTAQSVPTSLPNPEIEKRIHINSQSLWS